MSQKRRVILVIFFALLLGIVLIVLHSPAVAPPGRNQQQEAPTSQTNTDKKQPVSEFDRNQYSIDELGSVWQIINKKRSLPSDYVPSDLVVPDVRLRLAATHEQMKIRIIVEPDLIKMFEAAQKDNVTLVFGSGYRSYALQKQFYDSYVARDGQAAADRYSARPGTSEHQTGLAFDATRPDGKCHLEECFGNTEQGKWMAANAHKYGFTLRYRQGKESVTGYQYEPWHFRYVGSELASELHKTDQTLEELFGLN